ncbi:MAG: 4-hydroxy-tetrahydrodipicolinate reductase [Pseudomonadota bacterium]
MVRLGITGAAGRMGRMLVSAIHEHRDLTLAAAIERPGHPLLGADAGEVAGVGQLGVAITDDLARACEAFDVLIDFTIADATAANLEICRQHGRRMVIGTTGLSREQIDALTAAARDIAIVFAPNYSVGVNVTFKLAEIAARILGDTVDIEIIEAHHRHKVDAPSGTAIGLGQAVAGALDRSLEEVSVHGRSGVTGERDVREIGFHSIRAGEIVGDHTVLFASAGERVEITHRAQTRLNFAEGALRAAVWVAGRDHGLSDMQDVLGLKHSGFEPG